MAKKESSAQSLIKSLVSKALASNRAKSKSKRETRKAVEDRVIKKIADKLERSPSQVKKVYKGDRPGKNLIKPLKQIKNKKTVSPPPKRKPKPKEEPPPPVRPQTIKMSVKGYLGPYYDPEYLRYRSIIALTGEYLDMFLDAWDADDLGTAAQIAVGAYFEPTGNPGYIDISQPFKVDYQGVTR